MVSDKYQVRTTGPVHDLTQQPVKGRKRAGGIRFGEMERDSLLAHGVSFLLQDRLFNCSDYSQAHVCKGCGSILGIMAMKNPGAGTKASTIECMVCNTPDHVDIIAIPYVFRYLCTELAAMNVKLKLDVV
jgi:DNA-directed RNA polymerase I subunit RPA2